MAGPALLLHAVLRLRRRVSGSLAQPAARDPNAAREFIADRISHLGRGFGVIDSAASVPLWDMMAVAMARLLHSGETVFPHGVASPLPMKATLLAKRLHAPDLTYLNITGAVDAEPGETAGFESIRRCCMGPLPWLRWPISSDSTARGRLNVAFLSGVQVGVEGRINLSAIGSPSTSNGATPRRRWERDADADRRRRVILVADEARSADIVERLDFVTARKRRPGGYATRVFARHGRRLEVESLHPGVTPSVPERHRVLRSRWTRDAGNPSAYR